MIVTVAGIFVVIILAGLSIICAMAAGAIAEEKKKQGQLGYGFLFGSLLNIAEIVVLLCWPWL